jgi:hypothetical protein
VNEDAVDHVKAVEERVELCAHCGARNPPGLLLCLVCGRDPASGRDLFAPPDIPTPGEPPVPLLVMPSLDLTITLPDPIQVPDPLPIPTLEDFIAPPAQPHPMPPPVYRVPPRQPKNMAPLLSPLPRWSIGLLGLALLTFLGLGVIGGIATLNLPGSICLGSVWLVTAIVWLGIVLARQGESRSKTTGARRRLVESLGQRLFEITPSAAREQRAQLPAKRVQPLVQPASQLIYLSAAGDRTGQLTQMLLGTLCALVAGDHIELATQTYDVLTAGPFRHKLETIKRTAVSRRALYVGAGYLEKLIFEHVRRSPTTSIRELTTDVLRQAGADLLERIAAEISEASPSQTEAPLSEVEEAPDLDAQVAALREFCEELKTLNPDLYEGLTQEVEEAVQGFVRAARQRVR